MIVPLIFDFKLSHSEPTDQNETTTCHHSHSCGCLQHLTFGTNQARQTNRDETTKTDGRTGGRRRRRRFVGKKGVWWRSSPDDVNRARATPPPPPREFDERQEPSPRPVRGDGRDGCWAVPLPPFARRSLARSHRDAPPVPPRETSGREEGRMGFQPRDDGRSDAVREPPRLSKEGDPAPVSSVPSVSSVQGVLTPYESGVDGGLLNPLVGGFSDVAAVVVVRISRCWQTASLEGTDQVSVSSVPSVPSVFSQRRRGRRRPPPRLFRTKTLPDLRAVVASCVIVCRHPRLLPVANEDAARLEQRRARPLRVLVRREQVRRRVRPRVPRAARNAMQRNGMEWNRMECRRMSGTSPRTLRRALGARTRTRTRTTYVRARCGGRWEHVAREGRGGDAPIRSGVRRASGSARRARRPRFASSGPGRCSLVEADSTARRSRLDDDPTSRSPTQYQTKRYGSMVFHV